MENRICPIPKKDNYVSISASYEPVFVRALGKFTYLFFTRIPKDRFDFYSYFKDEAAQVSNLPTAGFNPSHLDPEPLTTTLNRLTNLAQAAENSAVGSHTFGGKSKLVTCPKPFTVPSLSRPLLPHPHPSLMVCSIHLT